MVLSLVFKHTGTCGRTELSFLYEQTYLNAKMCWSFWVLWAKPNNTLNCFNIHSRAVLHVVKGPMLFSCLSSIQNSSRCMHFELISKREHADFCRTRWRVCEFVWTVTCVCGAWPWETVNQGTRPIRMRFYIYTSNNSNAAFVNACHFIHSNWSHF